MDVDYPRKLQGMMLLAQDYNYDVKYKPGKDITVADVLSCAPIGESSHEEMVDVNNVTFSAIKPDRLDSIRRATKQDETLVKLEGVIQKGWPEEKSTLLLCTLPTRTNYLCKME